ncbi:hypothetical protein SXCC_03400 [Gluconacetobacter sp. SXCC-1]|nr:hypothetical protein SXCC_03400 [Gluconacetobacter sp. SXCC-1]
MPASMLWPGPAWLFRVDCNKHNATAERELETSDQTATQVRSQARTGPACPYAQPQACQHGAADGGA